ncbi:MAG: hypothetical protein MRJ65_14995 [Candidatus Brocadiaceae bacterium]|nr:hypothetical protein [Candidatus Brocadiaceae bacterium]
MSKVKKFKETALKIFKDPERFLLERRYGLKAPGGFRIELFIAREFKQICNTLKKNRTVRCMAEGLCRKKEKAIRLNPFEKINNVIANKPSVKRSKTAFCRYCEKRVVPKRIHKLDVGDIVLFLFTAGLWGMLVFIMFLFIRRCPYCNHSLRGLKPLSGEGKQ